MAHPPRSLGLAALFAVGSAGVLLAGSLLPSCINLADLLIPDAAYLLEDAGSGGGGYADLSVLLDGGTVAFGELQLTSYLDGGMPEIDVSIGPGGPLVRAEIFPDPLHSIVIGTNEATGLREYLYESASDGGVTQETEEEDTQGAGFFTQMNVRTIDTTGGLPFQTNDTRLVLLGPDGGPATSAAQGTWSQAWNYTGPAEANGGGSSSCNGYDGFPSNYATYNDVWPPYQPSEQGSALVQVFGTQIFILQNTGPGSCSAAGAKVLAEAFQDAIGRVAKFLAPMNPGKAALFASKVATQPLFVACSNACEGVNASTDLPDATWSDTLTWKFGVRAAAGYVQRMSLNMGSLQSHGCGDPASWEEVIIHELFHFAGVNHDPPTEGDPSGVDFVYCAGRYTSGCPGAGAVETPGSNGSIQDNARDCAIASSINYRSACGIAMFVDGTQQAQDQPLNCACMTSYWAHAVSCDYNHDAPLLDVNLGGQCCLSGEGPPNGCFLDPGCVPGLSWFGHLPPNPPPETNDCQTLPIGAFTQLRTCGG